MADQKITDLTLYVPVNAADVVPIVDTTSTAVTKKAAMSGLDTYLSATTKTLTNKTLTSPKINEDVVCSTTSTKLNYLTSATGYTGTNSQKIVFDTSPTINNETLAAGSTTAGTAPLYFTSSGAGTWLATPVAGAVEYDGTNFYTTIDATSGRGMTPTSQIYRITGAGPTFSSIADAFVASGSGFPTVASGVYLIECNLYYAKITNTGTLTWTLTSTTNYTNINLYCTTSPIAGPTAGNANAIAATAAATNAVAVTTGTLSIASHWAYLQAIVECGTAGNIRLRGTSSTASANLLRGSYMKMTRLYAGTVGTFVA